METKTLIWAKFATMIFLNPPRKQEFSIVNSNNSLNSFPSENENLSKSPVGERRVPILYQGELSPCALDLTWPPAAIWPHLFTVFTLNSYGHCLPTAQSFST